jgi:SAM-dependent methyltransferase
VVADIDRYGLPLTTKLCQACGTLRFDPYLDRESIGRFYTDHYLEMYARAPDRRDYVREQRAYGARILNSLPGLPAGASVCEVGCGAGGALSTFREAGYAPFGCDYSQELLDYGRQEFALSLTYGELAQLEAEQAGRRFHLIYLHHVFEHFSEPEAFLRAASRLLERTGQVLIVVPDVYRIGSYANPRGDLLQYLHLAHPFNYREEALRDLAMRCGFAARRIAPSPFPATRASNSSELWLLLRPAVNAANPELIAPTSSQSRPDYWAMLRRTEVLFQLGLTPAQLARLGRLASSSWWKSKLWSTKVPSAKAG